MQAGRLRSVRRRTRVLGGQAAGGAHRQRHAQGQERPDLGGPGRVQHRNEAGHVSQRQRVRGGGRQGDAQPDGRSGAGRLFLRRDDREDRRGQVPHHQGRLHDVRAADAAVADHVGLGDAPRRSLRVPEARDHQGEGRPGLLPAGALLPDPEGRPGDRLPDAHLRHVELPRHDVQRGVLLGDQPEPGRDVPLRLFLEAGAGLGRRLPVCRGAWVDREPVGLRPGRARDRDPEHRRLANGDAARPELPDPREHEPIAGPPVVGARADRLLHRHQDAAGLQHEHLRRLAQHPHVRREHQRERRGPLRERQLRPHRVLLGRDRPDRHGRHAARHGHTEREPAVRVADLLLDERGVRQPGARDAVRRRRQPTAGSRGST